MQRILVVGECGHPQEVTSNNPLVPWWIECRKCGVTRMTVGNTQVDAILIHKFLSWQSIVGLHEVFALRINSDNLYEAYGVVAVSLWELLNSFAIPVEAIANFEIAELEGAAEARHQIFNAIERETPKENFNLEVAKSEAVLSAHTVVLAMAHVGSRSVWSRLTPNSWMHTLHSYGVTAQK